jgi:hypothetical protein
VPQQLQAALKECWLQDQLQLAVAVAVALHTAAEDKEHTGQVQVEGVRAGARPLFFLPPAQTHHASVGALRHCYCPQACWRDKRKNKYIYAGAISNCKVQQTYQLLQSFIRP